MKAVSGNDAVARRHNRNFRIMQFCMGLFISSTIYASAYLKSLGLSSAQVGLFTAIRSVVGVFVPILWGMACDKERSVKKVFLVCLIGVIVLFPVVPFTEKIPLGSLMLAPWMTVIVRFFYRPLDFMFSSWLVQMEKHVPGFEYGKMRVFYSLASFCGSLLFSFLVKKGGIRISYFVGGVFAVIVLIALRPLQDVVPEGKEGKASFRDLKLEQLVKSPLLLAFILMMICANIPSSSSTIYMPYLLDDIGASVSVVSGFSAVRSLFGIPLMYFSGRLTRKFGARRLLTFSIVIYGLSEYAFSVAHSVPFILAIAVVVGINSGLMATSQVLYAQELAPPELRSTVQMLGSTALAAATIIASALGGYMVDAFGVRAYYRTTFAIVIVAVVLFIMFNNFILYRRRKQADVAETGGNDG